MLPILLHSTVSGIDNMIQSIIDVFRGPNLIEYLLFLKDYVFNQILKNFEGFFQVKNSSCVEKLYQWLLKTLL